MRFYTLASLSVLLGCSSVDLQASDASDAASDDTSLVFSDTAGGSDLGPSASGDDTTDTAGGAEDVLEGGDGEPMGGEDTEAPQDDALADVTGDDVPPGDDVTSGEDVSPGDVVEPASRCAVTDDEITCEYQTLTLSVGVLSESRDVLYQVPLTPPPAKGYPVAILFHGTQVAPELFWEGYQGGLAELGGLWYQVNTVKALLDAGFAVLTPRSQVVGYWNSNIAPTNVFWDSAPDNALMLDLIAAIAAGDFGDLDADRLYPAGISSGGYMTSRVAITYAGVRAAAIHSASYMTCAAAFCAVGDIPATHPPTLFLHGSLDLVVPVATMELYRDALTTAGVETKTVLDEEAAHEWLAASPEAIRDWFLAHP